MHSIMAYLGNMFAGPDVIVLFMLGAYILGIIAIIEVLKSRADSMTKLLWIVVIWFIPLLGLLLYYTIGKKNMRSA